MAFTFAEHYPLRLGEIRQDITTLPTDASSSLILLGDSLSEQNPAAELAGFSVVNMGISGDEIEHPEGGVLGRLDLLPPVRPAHVLLLIGINDLNNSRKSVDNIASQYQNLVQAVRSAVPAAALHLLYLLPTRDAFSRLMPDVKALNAGIMRIARGNGLPLADTFSALLDDAGALCAEFTEDGLHLNAVGYEALNEALEEHLRATAAK